MAEKGALRFPREEHLKRRQDIQTVFKKGFSASCSGARLFFLRRDGDGRRIAFTFARKFGSAVERNRARRLGREAYRHLRPRIKGGYDLVLLVYPDKNDFWEGRKAPGGFEGAKKTRSGFLGDKKSRSDFLSRLAQMRALLGKAGLLRSGALP
ncbi:MAG: ribonuclease P protein component [Spirochaetaceae bacterium]|jgi:ribonuclease P protein component|nr:ribonuclease P protein component [Spirochaetaceae bacterium]